MDTTILNEPAVLQAAKVLDAVHDMDMLNILTPEEQAEREQAYRLVHADLLAARRRLLWLHGNAVQRMGKIRDEETDPATDFVACGGCGVTNTRRALEDGCCCLCGHRIEPSARTEPMDRPAPLFPSV